jgi:hypothetical protein
MFTLLGARVYTMFTPMFTPGRNTVSQLGLESCIIKFLTTILSLMANFKACTRKQRNDGFWPVYIRVTQDRKVGYIKTDKLVTTKDITRGGNIKEPFVAHYCSELILRYSAKLNAVDSSRWSVNQVIDYLEKEGDDASFSDYAALHIERMFNRGQERNSRNYKMAVQHLERFLGTNKIMFSQLSSSVLQKWINSLERTHRAKEMYPTCVRQIFRAALVELNDEERGIIRIKFNPWNKLKIPQADQAEQLAISAEDCREFFSRPLPRTKMLSSLPELGRDVAMLILCLGGMNTVDIFNMKKENYRNGVFCYNRAKTMKGRADNAYFEMRIEPFIKPIVEKYKAAKDDPYFFNFHNRYCDSDSFCANANSGIKKICQDMGMPREKWYCCYSLRHSWGTIAQNDCDANLYDVAFGMNHVHGMRITRGYVKLDFTPAWNLNAKVIDFIFFSNKKSKQGGKSKEIKRGEEKIFRLSPKRMIYGRAYFKGEVLAELTDIGFSNVNSVIQKLVQQLPTNLPTGCAVQFRIKDCDTEQEAVYERSKGKGF